MINDVLTRLIEGLVAPRRSVRRLLDTGARGLDVILALLLLGYVIQSLAGILVPGSRPEIKGPLLGWHVAGFTMQTVVFLISSALVFGMGRLFGGRATLEESFVVMAWYGVVTSLLSPFILWGWASAQHGQANAFAALLMIGASGWGLVVLAAFVAELHRFRSTLIVLGAIFGMSVVLSFVLLSVMPPPG